MLPSGITVAFKFQNIMQFIFHNLIVQNLFSVTSKTPFFVVNEITFLVPLPYSLSFNLQEKNVNSNFASSSFPSLVSSDVTIAVLPSSKAELFAQTFVSNSTLDDS
ncbi:UNVERIFIED_CONTAM: hypothetical protein RMT77_001318 [Armadillidium vulgare]